MKKVDDNSNHHQTWHKHSLGTLTYVYQISSNLNNPIKSYGVWLGTSGTPCISLKMLNDSVMVLNALEVDPGRVWKGPWRWYHESMLDCCLPLSVIKETGINLQQFVCVAACNRLDTKLIRADVDDGLFMFCKRNHPRFAEYVAQFRRDLIMSVRSEHNVFVVSYDREVLGQTGSGSSHLSLNTLAFLQVTFLHWLPIMLTPIKC